MPSPEISLGKAAQRRAAYQDTHPDACQVPAGHRIDALDAQGPLCRAEIYNALRAGKLKAKKYGRVTIILDSEWRRFLSELPDSEPRAA